MGRQIRVTSKRRREPDVDKLVFALLRLLKQQQQVEETRKPHSKPGGASHGEGSAA